MCVCQSFGRSVGGLVALVGWVGEGGEVGEIRDASEVGRTGRLGVESGVDKLVRKVSLASYGKLVR